MGGCCARGKRDDSDAGSEQGSGGGGDNPKKGDGENKTNAAGGDNPFPEEDWPQEEVVIKRGFKGEKLGLELIPDTLEDTGQKVLVAGKAAPGGLAERNGLAKYHGQVITFIEDTPVATRDDLLKYQDAMEFRMKFTTFDDAEPPPDSVAPPPQVPSPEGAEGEAAPPGDAADTATAAAQQQDTPKPEEGDSQPGGNAGATTPPADQQTPVGESGEGSQHQQKPQPPGAGGGSVPQQQQQHRQGIPSPGGLSPGVAGEKDRASTTSFFSQRVPPSPATPSEGYPHQQQHHQHQHRGVPSSISEAAALTLHRRSRLSRFAPPPHPASWGTLTELRDSIRAVHAAKYASMPEPGPALDEAAFSELVLNLCFPEGHAPEETLKGLAGQLSQDPDACLLLGGHPLSHMERAVLVLYAMGPAELDSALGFPEGEPGGNRGFSLTDSKWSAVAALLQSLAGAEPGGDAQQSWPPQQQQQRGGLGGSISPGGTPGGSILPRFFQQNRKFLGDAVGHAASWGGGGQQQQHRSPATPLLDTPFVCYCMLADPPALFLEGWNDSVGGFVAFAEPFSATQSEHVAESPLWAWAPPAQPGSEGGAAGGFACAILAVVRFTAPQGVDMSCFSRDAREDREVLIPALTPFKVVSVVERQEGSATIVLIDIHFCPTRGRGSGGSAAGSAGEAAGPTPSAVVRQWGTTRPAAVPSPAASPAPRPTGREESLSFSGTPHPLPLAPAQPQRRAVGGSARDLSESPGRQRGGGGVRAPPPLADPEQRHTPPSVLQQQQQQRRTRPRLASASAPVFPPGRGGGGGGGVRRPPQEYLVVAPNHPKFEGIYRLVSDSGGGSTSRRRMQRDGVGQDAGGDAFPRWRREGHRQRGLSLFSGSGGDGGVSAVYELFSDGNRWAVGKLAYKVKGRGPRRRYKRAEGFKEPLGLAAAKKHPAAEAGGAHLPHQEQGWVAAVGQGVWEHDATVSVEANPLPRGFSGSEDNGADMSEGSPLVRLVSEVDGGGGGSLASDTSTTLSAVSEVDGQFGRSARPPGGIVAASPQVSPAPWPPMPPAGRGRGQTTGSAVPRSSSGSIGNTAAPTPLPAPATQRSSTAQGARMASAMPSFAQPLLAAQPPGVQTQYAFWGASP